MNRQRKKNTAEHTHVTIANNVSFLCARELVARPGETLDELFLFNTSVA
jgi:hypothetical protein